MTAAVTSRRRTAPHEQPWTLRDLLRRVARATTFDSGWVDYGGAELWLQMRADMACGPRICLRMPHELLLRAGAAHRGLVPRAEITRALDRLITLYGPEYPLTNSSSDPQQSEPVSTGKPGGQGGSGGAEPQGSGEMPARAANEPGGDAAESSGADHAGSAPAATSEPSTGDEPRESVAAPSPADGIGKRGQKLACRDCGEGASPADMREDGVSDEIVDDPDATAALGGDEGAEPDSGTGSSARSVDRALESASETLTDEDVELTVDTSPASAGPIEASSDISVEGDNCKPRSVSPQSGVSLLGPAGGRTDGSNSHLSDAETQQHLRTLCKERVARRLQRAIARYLDRELGAYGDATPRLDAGKLVTEIVGRSMRLARCRREEHEQSTAILAVDTSGSCAVYCAETMAAAILLAQADSRLVVVEHMNGSPSRVVTTRGERDLSPGVGKYESERNYALEWQELLQQHRTKSLIWLGDADGCQVREQLCIAQPDLRLLMLDNYTAKLGRARPAPTKVREPWACEHYVSVSSAATVLEALQKRS